MGDARHRRNDAPAFSAVELLVVLAVIAVLLALLLPAVWRARQSSIELTSISQVTRMFDTLMHVHLEEHETIPPWWEDEDGIIHSALHIRPDAEHPERPEPLHDFNIQAFEDPFRLETTIAGDLLLARLGSFVDEEHGPEGRGYFYVPFVSGVAGFSEDVRWFANSLCHPMWRSEPCLRDEDPPWTRMHIPRDTEYLLWGVGKNGVLDGDPALDVVLIKTEDNEGLMRHRPNQGPGAGIGQTEVEGS